MKLNKIVLFLAFNLIVTSLYSETRINNGFKEKNTDISDSLNNARIKEQESKLASSTASFTNITKEEVINTFYADPLSDEFLLGDSKITDLDRNQSTNALLNEFENKAKEINDNTEIPDDVSDNHTKEDRLRIEAQADRLLQEANKKDSDFNKSLGSTDITLQEKSQDEISIASNEELLIKNEDEQIVIDEDPEFKSDSQQYTEVDSEIIKDSVEENDSIEIPDYKHMSGFDTVPDSQEVEISKKLKEENSEPKKKKGNSKQKKNYFNFADPVLMTQGKPKSEDSEDEKIHTFTGLLVPEKQALGRRKHMLRWVLKLDDGTRIPLKSNLVLMKEVRNDSLLDDFVTVKGKMKTSVMEPNLKYLLPDTIKKDNSKKVSNNSKK